MHREETEGNPQEVIQDEEIANTSDIDAEREHGEAAQAMAHVI